MNIKINDFVGNILQNKFYACCYIVLYQVHALNIDAHLSAARRVARGRQWGQFPPPNSESCTKYFRSIKLLVCKPNKFCRVNHRKCLLLHNLVEPDQSTVVNQLSMINQTLCTKGGNSRIFQVKPRIFVGWAKMVKFHFFLSKLSKQPCLLEI